MLTETNNIIKFPGETIADIEAAAATWLSRVTSGSLTLTQLAEFEFWRAASPEHERAYQAMETTWEQLGAGSALKGSSSRYSATSFPRGRRVVSTVCRRMIHQSHFLAAIVAVVLTFQYISVWHYDYHTASGEIRRVVLPDGSIAHMKGRTALNFRTSVNGERTVELARGEVFFEVKHDASRPFTVLVGGAAVQDIGTAFSVSRTGQSSAVAVEEGVVAVAAGGRYGILNAGEQVSFSAYDLKRKSPVDAAKVAPWRRGMYIAENKSLGDALSDLNEYHAGRIIVSSRALAALRINAVVQLDHIDAWFDALGRTGNVSVRHWGPLTIVSERNK